MHCPRCGHEQTSDTIRFCTKCGLALGGVKEILVPELRDAVTEKKKNKIGKGVRQGLGMMLFGFVLITVLAILRDMNIVPQVFVKIAALIFCVGGAIRMCFPYLFNGNTSQETKNVLLEYDAETNNLADKNSTDKLLPQAQYYPPINLRTRNFDTAEMVQPPGVTEHTTKLLKDMAEQK
jgi:hypothetical protein